MNAFALTMDAILALLIMMLVVVIIAAAPFQNFTPRSVYLKQIALDELTILEKMNMTGRVIDGNTTSLREMLIYMPSSVCSSIEITESLSLNKTIISQPDCGIPPGGELQTAYSTFIHRNNFYIIRSQNWYRSG